MNSIIIALCCNDEVYSKTFGISSWRSYSLLDSDIEVDSANRIGINCFDVYVSSQINSSVVHKTTT